MKHKDLYNEIYHNMRNAIFEKVYSIDLIMLGLHDSELKQTAWFKITIKTTQPYVNSDWVGFFVDFTP